MTSEIVHPFDEQAQNNMREFITYTAHGTVEQVQYIDADLARFIHIVEQVTCGEIGVGLRIPSLRQNPSYPPLNIKPRHIRTRTRQKPAPEARSWSYLFLKHHPDVGYGYRRIGGLYGYDIASVKEPLMALEFALAREKAKPLRKGLQSVANALALAGYEAVNIRDFGRVA